MDSGYGGFSWEHHLSALMIVACLSNLEVALGKHSWQKYKVNLEEFEVLRIIRNSYVHTASDLSKISDSKGLAKVKVFLAKLTKGKIKGTKGENQEISPYFSINRSIVQLNKHAVRRTRSLYLQLMMKAGEIKP